MKPLELHIYEKHPDTDAYRVGGFYSPYCLVSRDKRFSDAELCAEYWAPTWLTMPDADWDDLGTFAKMRERSEVLYRFCTLPSYDEVGR